MNSVIVSSFYASEDRGQVNVSWSLRKSTASQLVKSSLGDVKALMCPESELPLDIV